MTSITIAHKRDQHKPCYKGKAILRLVAAQVSTKTITIVPMDEGIEIRVNGEPVDITDLDECLRMVRRSFLGEMLRRHEISTYVYYNQFFKIFARVLEKKISCLPNRNGGVDLWDNDVNKEITELLP